MDSVQESGGPLPSIADRTRKPRQMMPKFCKMVCRCPDGCYKIGDNGPPGLEQAGRTRAPVANRFDALGLPGADEKEPAGENIESRNGQWNEQTLVRTQSRGMLGNSAGSIAEGRNRGLGRR